MKLVELLEDIIESLRVVTSDSLVEITNKADLVVIEIPVNEPQTQFRGRLYETSYSDNLSNMNNNQLTSLEFRHIFVNDTEANVIVTFESRASKILATAKVITLVKYDELGNYYYA